MHYLDDITTRERRARARDLLFAAFLALTAAFTAITSGATIASGS